MADRSDSEMEPKTPQGWYDEGITSYKNLKKKLQNPPEDDLDRIEWMLEAEELSQKTILFFKKAIELSACNPEAYCIRTPYDKGVKLPINTTANTFEEEELFIDVAIKTKSHQKLGRLYCVIGQHKEAIENLDIANSGRLDLKSRKKNFLFRGISNFYLANYSEAVADIIFSETSILKNKYIMDFSSKKEEILTAINKPKDKKQTASILFQCLLPYTIWGEIFYYQRGIKACTLETGILTKIVKLLADIRDINELLKDDPAFHIGLNELNKNPELLKMKVHLQEKIPTLKFTSTSTSPPTRCCTM